ncbi:MAG: hypothetical protein HY719_12590 [Planctomycetes bacterium]|nr:hypothetical protein [Planctomycetota bacterium]
MRALALAQPDVMAVAPLILLDLVPPEWARAPQALLDDPRVQWRKVSRTGRVGFFESGGIALVVKLRAMRRPGRMPWRRTGRRPGFTGETRPHRETRAEWEMGERFRHFGWDTPRRVALLPPFGDGAGRVWSGVIMTRVPGVTLERLLAGGDPLAASSAVAERLAACARAMHAGDCHHQDFYAGHVFVAGAGDLSADALPRLGLVDFARAACRPGLRRRWIVKDLAQLAYSTAAGSAAGRGPFDFDRFLRAYLNLPAGAALSRAQRRLAAAIARKAAAIRARAPKVLARRAYLSTGDG